MTQNETPSSSASPKEKPAVLDVDLNCPPTEIVDKDCETQNTSEKDCDNHHLIMIEVEENNIDIDHQENSGSTKRLWGFEDGSSCVRKRRRYTAEEKGKKIVDDDDGLLELRLGPAQILLYEKPGQKGLFEASSSGFMHVENIEEHDESDGETETSNHLA